MSESELPKGMELLTSETLGEYGLDEDGDYLWPGPPERTTSRAWGRLRTDVLTRVGLPHGEQYEVRVVETMHEGGWSEYTSENWFDIEVHVINHQGDETERSRLVFEHDDASSTDSSFAHLMAWLEGATS